MTLSLLGNWLWCEGKVIVRKVVAHEVPHNIHCSESNINPLPCHLLLLGGCGGSGSEGRCGGINNRGGAGQKSAENAGRIRLFCTLGYGKKCRVRKMRENADHI